MEEIVHTPVLLDEVITYLNPQPGKNYIDATADGGGHAIEIIKRIRPSGRLLALEWDKELFQVLHARLKKECPHFSKNYALRRMSFTELADSVRWFNSAPVAGILFDIGLSSYHLEASRRGFSFQRDESLDMRYSWALERTAADIIAQFSREELEALLRKYGEERFSRRIAERIAAVRREHPIRRTSELVAVIGSAVPPWYRRSRLHFATRTFQALRIAVNHELENLPRGLAAACQILSRGGRLLVITFHSLEDRVVKDFFREKVATGQFRSLTPKPVRPSREETLANRRARSAKLRVIEKQL